MQRCYDLVSHHKLGVRRSSDVRCSQSKASAGRRDDLDRRALLALAGLADLLLAWNSTLVRERAVSFSQTRALGILVVGVGVAKS